MLDSAQKVYNSIVDLGRKVPRLFWIHSKLNAIKIKIRQLEINPIKLTRKLKKDYENFPYMHLIDQFEGRYYLDKGLDSLAISSYNKSLSSKNVDLITRKANYRELSNHFLGKAFY